MATHTITITDSMVIIGPGDPNLWGTLEWGTNNWATDNDMRLTFFKNLAAETITLSDVLSKKPFLTLDMGTMVGAITMSTLCHFDGFLEFKYVRAGDAGVDGFDKTSDGSDGWSKTSDGSDGWSAV